MKELLRSRSYVYLISANLINRLGDSVDAIASTWLVYQLTQNPMWSTIIFGSNMVPTIFLQPLAGVFVEKVNKKHIMILVDILRGICVLLLVLLFLANRLDPWILLLLTIINSSLEAFRMPAGNAMPTYVLPRDLYERGISLYASLSRLVELVGTALAGVVIGCFGLYSAMLIDMASFFLSALLLMRITYVQKPHEGQRSGSYFRDLKEGVTYVMDSPLLKFVIFTGMTLNGLIVPFNSLLAVYVNDYLSMDADALSLLMMSLSIGMIGGSILYPKLSSRLHSKYLMTIGFGCLGGFYFFLVFCPVFLVLVAVFLILGLSVGMLNTFVSVLLLSNVKEEALSRVSGLFSALVTCCIPLFSGFLTFLLIFLTYPYVFLIFGLAAVGLSAYFIFKKFRV